MKDKKTKQHNTVQFFEFWYFIAQQLGSSRLKINQTAHNIHQLLDAKTGNHANFLHDAIHESYKRNRCNTINSPISIESILDILGETAYTLRDRQRDDLFDIELLEEIAWYIAQHFGHLIKLDTHSSCESAHANNRPMPGSYDAVKHSSNGAQVISFPNYKIRIANANN